MGRESDHDTEVHVSTVQRAFEQRLANPLLRWLLRSPVHWLASRWLVLVAYEGRRSGRRYTFPVAYERVDGAVVAVTPMGESNWWRNFREPRSCRLWLAGAPRDARGVVVTDDEGDRLLATYLDHHPLLARQFGVGGNASAARQRASDALAVVRFDIESA